jgi:hypothetical protein
VVVVEEHRRFGLRVQLGDNGVGEAGVDGDVPLVPGEMESPIEVGSTSEIPQVMLEKPERRVGDDVVEPVVRGLVMSNETQAIRRPVMGRYLDRPVLSLGGDGPVLVAHGARHPGDVVERHEASQRRHQPSPAASRYPFAVFVQVESNRSTVRDDDQLPAGGHGP